MGEKVFSFDQVVQHNKLGDCWLIISGKVYDVSKFLQEHPGGDDVILTSTGKDATEDFEDVGHSSYAILKREEFLIGHIDKSTLPKPKLDHQYIPQTASSKTTNLWLYLFIMGAALFLGFYSKEK